MGHCKNKLFIGLIITFLGSNFLLHSQVGINTTNPRKTLEVAGDVVISNDISVGTLNPLEDGDENTFLVQNSNLTLRSLNVKNPTSTALGYIQEYIITNPNLDWVLDFDTGVDASEYVLVAISAFYDLELETSTSGNAIDNASLPYTATFISGGTWHIIADYPMVANEDTSAIGTWHVNTLIYSNDLSKQFGIVSIPMSGATTGSALTPIID